MKKLLIIFLILLFLPLASAGIKDFYSWSSDTRDGNCGGISTGDPHPYIANGSNSVTPVFCDCGWTGATCTYNSNSVTIYFSQKVSIPADALSMVIGSCFFNNFSEYTIYRFDTFSREVVVHNEETGGLCDDLTPYDQFNFTHPAILDTSAIRFDLTVDNVDNGVFIREIYFGDEEETAFNPCIFPSIFCDDFDYTFPFASKDVNKWDIEAEDGSLDLTFSPSGGWMKLEGDEFISPKHFNPTFGSDFQISESQIILDSDTSPVFTSEFKIAGITEGWEYEVYDSTLNRRVYKLIALNTSSSHQSLYYLNTSGGNSELCSDCLPYNNFNTIKVSSFFVDQDFSHYNATFNDNYLDIYVDTNETDYSFLNIPFYDNSSFNQKFQYFEKQASDVFYINDYFIYIGTDKTVSTVDQYYIDLFGRRGVTGSWGVDVGESQEGSPCEDNSECLSGKCLDGYCSLKLGKESCLYDDQCLSGQCLNNKCTKPSAGQLLGASKSEIVGDDPTTNNMVSLLFMVGIPGAIVFGGAGSGLVIFVAILVFLVLGFFFAIVGWLSPFILLGVVLGGLIIFVLFMMMRGSSS